MSATDAQTQHTFQLCALDRWARVFTDAPSVEQKIAAHCRMAERLSDGSQVKSVGVHVESLRLTRGIHRHQPLKRRQPIACKHAELLNTISAAVLQCARAAMGGTARGTTRIDSRGKARQCNPMHSAAVSLSQYSFDCLLTDSEQCHQSRARAPGRCPCLRQSHNRPTDHSRGGPCGLAAAVRHSSPQLDALKLLVSK